MRQASASCWSPLCSNHASHGDGYYIAASPPLRNRACLAALGLTMTTTDVAAWIGALTGTFVLLWDIFKWVRSGARIKVSASPNMTGFGSAAQLLGNNTCVVVEAINVGQSKTTITHLVGFHYQSWWNRLLRRKPSTTFLVPDPRPGTLPHVLDIGERWLGMIEQNDELEKMSQEGCLYVGIYHSTGRQPKVQRLIIHAVNEA